MPEARALLAQWQVPLSSPISIDGGMSRNPWFCQFLADILGRDLRISDEAELTALGCAQLAALGAGTPLDLMPAGRTFKPREIPAEWRSTFRSALEAVQHFGAR